MTKKIYQDRALDGRIKQGKADPITSTEKRLVAEFREGFEQKFGKSELVTRTAKSGRFITTSRAARTVSRTTESKTSTGRSAANTSQLIHQSSKSAAARIKPSEGILCCVQWEHLGIRSTGHPLHGTHGWWFGGVGGKRNLA